MSPLSKKIDDLLTSNALTKMQLDQAVDILQPAFQDRSDAIVEIVLKDPRVFAQALKVLEVADKCAYHTLNLTTLRVRVFDVLVGIVRDFEKTELINAQLQRDFEAGISLNKVEVILYHTNLFLYKLIYRPNFEKALLFGKKTLDLIMVESEMFEEKLRLFSNFIQCYSLMGEFEEAQKFIAEGEKYFSLAASSAYQALYILAVSAYHNERGNFEATIDLIQTYRPLLEKQQAYPSMYFFTLNQLSYALLNSGHNEEGSQILEQAMIAARKFHTFEETHFFARWYALKALSQLSQPALFLSSKEMLEKSLKIYHLLYGGEVQHPTQAFVYLLLAKLFYLNKHDDQALTYSHHAKVIFTKILKGHHTFESLELEKLLSDLNQ